MNGIGRERGALASDDLFAKTVFCDDTRAKNISADSAIFLIHTHVCDHAPSHAYHQCCIMGVATALSARFFGSLGAVGRGRWVTIALGSAGINITDWNLVVDPVICS